MSYETNLIIEDHEILKQANAQTLKEFQMALSRTSVLQHQIHSDDVVKMWVNSYKGKP